MPPTTPHGLTFDADTHRYRLDGRRVPGVTSIIGALDKSGPLTRWAARTVAEYVWDNPDQTTRLLAGSREECVRSLIAVPDAVRDGAAGRGSTIHAHAEAILRAHAADVDDTLVPVVQGIVRFLEEWEIDPILTEYACASREHQWAGTGDTIAHYRNPNTGHRGVLYADWKSGKNTYGESGLQFAAYVHCSWPPHARHTPTRLLPPAVLPGLRLPPRQRVPEHIDRPRRLHLTQRPDRLHRVILAARERPPDPHARRVPVVPSAQVL